MARNGAGHAGGRLAGGTARTQAGDSRAQLTGEAACGADAAASARLAEDAAAKGTAAERAAHLVASPACAIIVAAGSGTRFGNPGGKLLVEVADRPLLSWTIEAFDRAASIAHIVVVCADEKRAELAAAAVGPFGFTTPLSFASGGATRQDSTRAGLAAAPAELGIVAVHDGARPLIEPATIDASVAALVADPALDGVVCGQPAIDTLKLVGEGSVIEATPDRARYWCVQTPQVFHRAILQRAFEAADAEGFTGTDDASLVERAGGRVRCIDAPRDNLKVTVPEDLVPVDAMMRARFA